MDELENYYHRLMTERNALVTKQFQLPDATLPPEEAERLEQIRIWLDEFECARLVAI